MKIHFLILIIALIISSCGEDFFNMQINDELPYEKKLVLYCHLEMNDTNSTIDPKSIRGINEVFVSKTMPALGPILPDTAYYVKDAIVTLEWEGGKEIARKTNSSMSNRYILESQIIPGRTYKLKVEAEGMTAFAETTIPDVNTAISDTSSEIIERFGYKEKRYFLYAAIPPNYAIQGVGLKFSNLDSTIQEIFFDSYNNGIQLTNGNRAVYKVKYYTDYYSLENRNDYKPGLMIYSPDYFYYRNSTNNSEEDFFFGTGTNPYTNVKGDGIGIFFSSRLLYTK